MQAQSTARGAVRLNVYGDAVGGRMPSSVVIYRGPSKLTGAAIVVIVTGLDGSSVNAKTGAMAQVWILADYWHPVDAARRGADVAVCGDCPLRPTAPGNGPRCYVNKGFGPAAVYRAVEAGMPSADPRAVGEYAAARGLALRLGAYGDPAAVPVEVWHELLAGGARHTGYTHQWRRAPQLRGIVMASCDSPADRVEAARRGWRTFRVRQAADPIMPGEISCPASAEGGTRTQCASCRLCNGARQGDRRASVVIIDHGPTAPRVPRRELAKVTA